MIEDLIKNSTSKNILFLGKLISLSSAEIKSFLEKEGFNFCDIYEEEKDYAFVVLSSLINPYEEDISYAVYNRGIKDIKLEEFEAYYIGKIKPNSLVMSVKLKNDQSRIKRLLNLKSISPDLYLQLLKMYRWEEGGVFDTNSNRDVTTSYIKKFFIKKEGVNHNEIVHSPANLVDIAFYSNSTDALKAMLKFPDYKINPRGQEPWKPRELKEFIALNEHIDSEIIDTLLRLNSTRLDTLLALNSQLTLNQKLVIYNRANEFTKINLAQNHSLEDELFIKLLNENIEVIKSLLNYQKITKDRLKLIKDDYLELIGDNIEDVLEDILFKNKSLDFKIAKNTLANIEIINKLYQKYGNEIAANLSANINTPKEMLENFYQLNSKDIDLNLASNKSTPQYIINQLCQKDDIELNKKLAINPNLPKEYMEYFKLDTTLLKELCKNENFK